MSLKIIIESAVVGLAVQVVVGWITPLTLIFTGFAAGVAARDEREGTIAGLIVGAVTGFGFVLRWYLNLQISYLYPTSWVITILGQVGIYVVALVMIALGIIGGKVGGSVIHRYTEESYRHGEMFGESKVIAGDYRKQRIPRRSGSKKIRSL
jgi:hypothetical protein